MATLAKLIVKLVTDVTEFTSGLDTAAKKMGETSTKLNSIGNKMSLGVTAPLVAAGTAAVNFASDLEETRNKTRVVFGDMADQVLAMGSTANQSMGMSENAALSYAATYGSILKNMGLNEQQVAEMSTELTGLTADYASFHNLKPEEAFEKIKAGLVGSSEPLIALGKDLRVAAVEQYALDSGLSETGDDLTNQQLAMARYGLLLKQSTDELGDFGRTSDGLANSTRRMTATTEDLGAGFGELLIPTVLKFMQALLPVLDFFNELPDPVKQGIVTFLAIAAAMGPIMKLGGGIIGVVGKIIPLIATLAPVVGAAAGGIFAAILPILPIILGIVAVITLVALAWKNNWFDIQHATENISIWITNRINDLKTAITNTFENIKTAITNTVTNIKTTVTDIFTNLKTAVTDKFDELKTGVTDIFNGLVDSIFDAGKNLVTRFVDGIKEKWDAAVNTVSGLVEKIRDFLPGSDAKMGPLSDLFASGRALGRTLAAGFVSGSPALITSVNRTLDKIQPTMLVPEMGSFAPGAAVSGVSAGGFDVSELVRTIQDSKLDEARLARMIRDAIVQVTR